MRKATSCFSRVGVSERLSRVAPLARIIGGEDGLRLVAKLMLNTSILPDRWSPGLSASCAVWTRKR